MLTLKCLLEGVLDYWRAGSFFKIQKAGGGFRNGGRGQNFAIPVLLAEIIDIRSDSCRSDIFGPDKIPRLIRSLIDEK